MWPGKDSKANLGNALSLRGIHNSLSLCVRSLVVLAFLIGMPLMATPQFSRWLDQQQEATPEQASHPEDLLPPLTPPPLESAPFSHAPLAHRPAAQTPTGEAPGGPQTPLQVHSAGWTGPSPAAPPTAFTLPAAPTAIQASSTAYQTDPVASFPARPSLYEAPPADPIPGLLAELAAFDAENIRIQPQTSEPPLFFASCEQPIASQSVYHRTFQTEGSDPATALRRLIDLLDDHAGETRSVVYRTLDDGDKR
ncbi:hypothetical protein [Lignipirellula cremea]|uniref:Uncharacterized protein n=1 Tax=Lignipirellula cremea TaxID=2528010 RepID=A0A518DNK3_9BACT|nr:hypothetical protein [Lignipirellula cremea]QDU93411.1 hypothetical protein Pla8534_11910 [Lignipirellula cremea]